MRLRALAAGDLREDRHALSGKHSLMEKVGQFLRRQLSDFGHNFITRIKI